MALPSLQESPPVIKGFKLLVTWITRCHASTLSMYCHIGISNAVVLFNLWDMKVTFFFFFFPYPSRTPPSLNHKCMWIGTKKEMKLEYANFFLSFLYNVILRPFRCTVILKSNICNICIYYYFYHVIGTKYSSLYILINFCSGL